MASALTGHLFNTESRASERATAGYTSAIASQLFVVVLRCETTLPVP